MLVEKVDAKFEPLIRTSNNIVAVVPRCLGVNAVVKIGLSFLLVDAPAASLAYLFFLLAVLLDMSIANFKPLVAFAILLSTRLCISGSGF